MDSTSSRGQYIPSDTCIVLADALQLVATGTLRAHFDGEQKIELLEFNTSNHEEYLSKSSIIEAARPLHEWVKEWHRVNNPPDSKQSPEMNKKKAKAMKSPNQPPPSMNIPLANVKSTMGITPSVFQFLEVCLGRLKDSQF